MSSFVFEAAIYAIDGECCHAVLSGVFALIKVGDLVSDIIFLITFTDLNDFFGDVNEMADEADKIDFTAFFFTLLVLTLIGAVFDIAKFLAIIRRWKRAKQPKHEGTGGDEGFSSVKLDEDETGESNGMAQQDQDRHTTGNEDENHESIKKRQRWESLNFWLEEMPQFFVMASLAGSVSADDFLRCKTFLDVDDDRVTNSMPPEECNEDQRDYISNLEQDFLISFVLTVLVIVQSVFLFFKTRQGCYCCQICGICKGGSNTPTTIGVQTFSPPTTPSGGAVSTTTVTETVRPDGSKSIRKEVLHPNGSVTVTITEIRATNFRADDTTTTADPVTEEDDSSNNRRIRRERQGTGGLSSLLSNDVEQASWQTQRNAGLERPGPDLSPWV